MFAASLASAGKAEGAEVSPGEILKPVEIDIPRGDEAERQDDGTGRAAPANDTAPDASNELVMLASYYDRSLEGNPTASGVPFDADDYTAAHKSLPLGTQLLVSYGGASVRVTVNDRGPYVAGRDIDLSLAAAQDIGLTSAGVAPVRVTVL